MRPEWVDAGKFDLAKWRDAVEHMALPDLVGRAIEDGVIFRVVLDEPTTTSWTSLDG